MSEAKKITLPSGATVTLRDENTIRYKDRKMLYKTVDKETDTELGKALAMTETLIQMLVVEWSFDLPVPMNKKESLEELSIADFDALVEKTKEIQKALFPSLSDTPENEANPKAIIANSNG